MKRLFLPLLLLGCLNLFGGEKVDINTAGKAGLETVKGIGPVLAQKILDYRAAHGPFLSVDDLQKVKGIGPSTLKGLKPMLTASQVVVLDPEASVTPDSARLNINTATDKELDELPGIGEVLSKRIVAYRDANGPFKSVEDLVKVDGLRKSTVEKIASKITAGATAASTATKVGETNSSGRKLKVWRPGL